MSNENESLVAACVDDVNSVLHTKTPYNLTPTVLPLFVDDVDSSSAPLIGKAVRFQPSSSNCGCFVATVAREVNVRTAQQRTVIQQYGDWYTSR